MATIGYARVSSADQNCETQIARLKAAGCTVVRSEKASGKSRDGRSELATNHENVELVLSSQDRPDLGSIRSPILLFAFIQISKICNFAF